EFWLRAGAAGLSLRHVPVKLGQFRMIAGTKSLSAPTVFWLDNMEIFRRHNRPGAMTGYFTYFHFNHAPPAGPDFAPARAAEEALFERWRDLPAAERDDLRRRSESGRRRACLLAALAALRDGQDQRAGQLLHAAVAGRRRMWMHPLAWLVLAAPTLRPPPPPRFRARWGT